MIRRAGVLVCVVAAGLLAGGCAGNPAGAYFLNTKTKAMVFVSPKASNYTKVALMPLKAPTELIGSSVSDMLVNEILMANQYVLVERGQIAKVLGETELALSGLSDSKAVAAARMAGAEAVIIGTVDEYSMSASRGNTYPNVGLTTRMIDCNTGEIIWTGSHASRGGDSSATLPEHARKVVHEMTSALYKQWIKLPKPKRVSQVDQKLDTPAAAGVPGARPPEAIVVRPPAKPQGIQVSDMGLREATIRWAKPFDDVKTFRIERATSAKGQFSEIARVSASKYEYRDTGSADAPLKDFTTYYYRIVPISSLGMEGPASDAKESMTAPPPDPPQGLKADPFAARAMALSWKASTAEGVVRYIVERGDGKNFTTLGETRALTFKEGGKADSPLADSTKYFYRVTSVNKVGAVGSPSAPVAVTTRPPPAKVTGFKGMTGEVRCVPLAWDQSPEEDVVRYDLYWAEGKTGVFEKLASLKGRNKTTYLDGGKDPGSLLDDHEYRYRIRAVNEVGSESADSGVIVVRTRPVPPQVTRVMAEDDFPRMVPVNWTASPDEKVLGYVIGRRQGTNALAEIETVEGRASAKYVDRGGARASAKAGNLKDGTAYDYAVCAFNTAKARSPWSEMATARTRYAPREVAEVKASSNTPKAVEVSWEPNIEEVKEYVVESSSKRDGKFNESGKMPASDSTNRIVFVEQKLDDGEQRYYRVKAVDKDGIEGPCSGVVAGNAKPLPSAPTGLASEKSEGGALLKWTKPPQKDVTKYKVWKKGFLKSSLLGESEKVEFNIPAAELGKEADVCVSAVDADGLESERSGTLKVKVGE